MPVSDKQPLSARQVADVVASVDGMGQADKERLADALYAEQPNVLYLAIRVARMDVAPEVKDAAIDTALILFQSLGEELRTHGRLTEAEVEHFVEQNAAMVRFLDGEEGEAFTRSVGRTVEGYPEPALLAHAVGRLNELDVEDPQVITTIKVMLDLCVSAKWPGLERPATTPFDELPVGGTD